MLGIINFLAIILMTAQSFDPMMDSSMFNMVWLESKTDHKDLSVSTNSIVLKTRDHEQYKCFLPETIQDQDKDDKRPYRGLTEMELLKPLFESSQCYYRLESYWVYELCHGRYLRQYHEDKEPGKKPKLQEYYLGYYGKTSPDQKEDEIEKEKKVLNQDSSNTDQLTISQLRKLTKKRKLGDLNLPYFRVNFTSGTTCDVTQKPRIANILYICHKGVKADIIETKEVSSCEYEAVVLTEHLCAHPAYVYVPKRSQKIRCLPLNNSPIRPKSLEDFKSNDLRHHTNRVNFPTSKDEDEGDDDEDLGQEIASSSSPKETMPEKVLPDSKPRQPHPRLLPHDKEKMIMDIINGGSCIDGGSGWWKHEFCFQKHVQQYHEEKNGRRTAIKLGEWSEKYQRWYMDKNPSKRPSADKQSRKLLTQYYPNGDVCEETRRNRFVEVKLKCIEKASSAHSISIYMLEPKTCEYILIVESELVCSIIEKADEDGIIPLQMPPSPKP